MATAGQSTPQYTGEPPSPIRPAHERERSYLREDVDTVLLVASNREGDPKLHLPTSPGETETLCDRDGGREKPVESYPPGWRSWCRVCLSRWRDGEWEADR